MLLSSSVTTASLEQGVYEFLESATDAAVCVELTIPAERTVSVSLSTVDGTAIGNDRIAPHTFA